MRMSATSDRIELAIFGHLKSIFDNYSRKAEIKPLSCLFFDQ